MPNNKNKRNKKNFIDTIHPKFRLFMHANLHPFGATFVYEGKTYQNLQQVIMKVKEVSKPYSIPVYISDF